MNHHQSAENHAVSGIQGLFADVTHQMRQGLLLLSTANTALSLDQTARELLGYTVTSLSEGGPELPQLIHADDYDYIEKKLRTLWRHEQPSDTVFARLLRRDGSDFYAVMHLSVMRRHQDTTLVAVTFSALKESPRPDAKTEGGQDQDQTQIHRTVLDNDPHICILADEDHKIIDCNLEAMNFLGYRNKAEMCDRVVGKALDDDGDTPGGQPSFTERLVSAAELGHCAYEGHLGIGGRVVPVEVTMKRLPRPGGYIIAIYITDLTEIKDSVTETAARQELLQAVNGLSGQLLEAEPEKAGAVITKSLDHLLRLLDADNISVYTTEGREEDATLRCIHSCMTRYYKRADIDNGDDIDTTALSYVYEALRQGRVVNGPARELPLEEQKFARLHGIRSLLMLPVMHAGELWGCVSFCDCRRERYFGGTEEQLLKIAAAQIAAALIHRDIRKHLEQTKKELQIQENLLRGVNEVAALLLGNFQYDFLRTVRQALMVLGHCVEGDHASVWKNAPDADGEIVSTRVAGWIVGRPIDEEKIRGHFSLFDFVPSWRGVRREPVILSRSELGDLIPRLSLPDNAGALLLVPLSIRGEFWGFAAFSHPVQGYPFPQAQINLLRSGSMMIASAVKREEDNQGLVQTREKAVAQALRQRILVSRISREIRAPLNSVTGITSLAARDPEAREQRQRFAAIDEAARQILGAVGRLLISDDPDNSETMRLNPAPINLRHFLQNIKQAAEPFAAQRRQHLEIHPPAHNERLIVADEARLAQLVRNLLENAVKFTPAGGTVTLSAHMDAPDEDTKEGSAVGLRITVSDTGIGIPEELREALFKAARDEDYFSRNSAGVPGYGLVLCQAISAQMNGVIRVESEPGKGSVFTFEAAVQWGGLVPPETDGTEKLAVAEADNGSKYRRNWKDYGILLAEDVEINTEILIAMLQDTGVRIHAVPDGQKAVLAYQQAPGDYDLIILDLQMPVMDGIKAAKLIRGSGLPGARSIPIIAMTASALRTDNENTRRAGFDCHLTKPVDIDRLYDSLDAYLGKRDAK